jgi:hypothetical protein
VQAGLAPRRVSDLALWLGLAGGLASLVVYDRSGYGHGMLALWLLGLAALVAFFASRSRSFPRIELLDLVLPAALIAALSPLYVAALYRWPVQVNSDEIAVATAAKRYVAMDKVDPFGLTDYLGHPVLLFLGLGRAGRWLGGIDLAHMRLVHALLGLVLLAVSYALFRQLLPRNWALFATLVMGACHSLFMLSRLAMRENTDALAEVTALALLLWGIRHDNWLFTFAGGFAGGLGFYVYYPGRVAFPLWLLFLVGLGLLYRSRFPVRKLVTFAAVAAAGFVVMAGPVLIAERNAPKKVTETQRLSSFIYPEGREVQRQWVFASTELGGYQKNIEFGLGTFNNGIQDHSWIYANEGHGFVDPLTGILLWIGVVLVGLRAVRRREDPWPLLMLGSFVALWLAFAFLINKAPNYTRLLVTLPFVAYFVAEATRWLAGRWRSVRFGPALVTGGVIVAVLVWNPVIAWDFIQQGRKEGEPIGTTGRYVEAHRDVPGQRFYFANQDSNIILRYYVWGETEPRISLFVHDPTQLGGTIDPSTFSTFSASPPFSLFMRRSAWNYGAADLADRYPQGRLRNITPDGSRVVLEVPVSS